jgi:hypothetical protein
MFSASGYAGIEGKKSINGPVFSHSVTGVTADHLFTIRNKTTYQSKNNRVRLFLKVFSILNDANTSGNTFTIIENASLDATAIAGFTDEDTTNSVVEYTEVGTATGGTEIVSFSVGKDSGDTRDLFESLFQLDPGKTFSVIQTAGNSSNASLSWVEDI